MGLFWFQQNLFDPLDKNIGSRGVFSKFYFQTSEFNYGGYLQLEPGAGGIAFSFDKTKSDYEVGGAVYVAPLILNGLRTYGEAGLSYFSNQQNILWSIFGISVGSWYFKIMGKVMLQHHLEDRKASLSGEGSLKLRSTLFLGHPIWVSLQPGCVYTQPNLKFFGLFKVLCPPVKFIVVGTPEEVAGEVLVGKVFKIGLKSVYFFLSKETSFYINLQMETEERL